MAQLMVRNLPEDLIKALKQRAAKHNRSAEQEHREILRSALRGPRRRHLAEVLASMPKAGEDHPSRASTKEKRHLFVELTEGFHALAEQRKAKRTMKSKPDRKPQKRKATRRT